MLKSLNILLIEDDMIEVMKFNRVLKTLDLNHKIIEANNGEEAIAVLKRKKCNSKYYYFRFKHA